MWAGGMWHVDPTHNTLITTGNAGSESTAAEVTLFYNGGKSKYRMEKMLAPSQQLWLDVGHLVHDQVPDSDGRTLPPDTMTGSYELRDLDHATVGQLYEGKLIIDKTYGHASYGCGTCCGDGVPTLLPNPFGGPPGINNTDVMQSLEQCTGDLIDLADSAYGWKSSNTTVATLPTKVLHTVAVGSATGSGTVYVQADKPAPRCPMAYYTPQQPVNVQPTVSVSCQLTDMALNSFASTATCFATVNPTGGTFTWESNNTKTISVSCTDSGCGSSVEYTAIATSTTEDDSTITGFYTYKGQEVDDTSDPITVHQPKSLRTNSTTANYRTTTCTLPCLANPNKGSCAIKSGTSCSYSEPVTRRYYSVLDQFGNAFEDVNLSVAPAITEIVTANQGTCGGNGVEISSTSGSPFYDEFGKCDSCCESGGPGCTSTASQTILSNGVSVRQESISVTCTTATLMP